MKPYLLAGVGAFFGAMGRLGLGGMVLRMMPNSHFPWGTLTVNLLGCLLIGLVAGFAERTAALNADMRVLLITGVLGGFTTFSAFGLESLTLIKRGDWVPFLGYAIGSVTLGVLLVWAGWIAMTRTFA